jgi:GNAT superfamily N-acetyltransferase
VTEGEIVIRLGTVEDYPAARAVIAETLAFHCEGAPAFFQEAETLLPSEAYLADLLEGGNGAWFLADHEGEIVGFVTVRLRLGSFEPFQVPEPRAIVDQLGIAAAWRRRGIGRRLMEAAHEWARQHGARRVLLNVWEFNEGALALYASLGYTTINRNMAKVI